MTTPPSDRELLCESCGYVLTGSDSDGPCAECGVLAAESLASCRDGATWQREKGVLGHVRGLIAAVLRPGYESRRLIIRDGAMPSRLVANIVIAAALLTGAFALAQPTTAGTFSRSGAELAGICASFIALLMVMTWIETRGVRLFGRQRAWRITPAVAWSVCTQASFGWIVGAAVAMVVVPPLAPLLGVVQDLPGADVLVPGRGPRNALALLIVLPVLGFELLVYVGIRRCRFANRP